MLWLITAVLGAVVLYLLHSMFEKKKNYWKNVGVPYVPNALPLVGNSLDVILGRQTMAEQLVRIYETYKEEKYVGYISVQMPTLMVRDLDLINQIIIKDFVHFTDRGFLVENEKIEPLSVSLDRMSGDRWRSLRHKLTPTFTSGKLKVMFEQMKACAESTADFVKGKAEAIDARLLMSSFSMDVIGAVAFGLDIDAHRPKDEGARRFLEMSRRFLQPSPIMMFNLLAKQSLPKLARLLRLKTIDEEVSNFFIKLVKDTVSFRDTTTTKRNDFLQLILNLRDQERARLQNKQQDNQPRNGFEPLHNTPLESKEKEETDADDQILLDQLKGVGKYKVSDKPEFTDNVIAANSFIFISGGSETTAAVLHFALYELATHPEAQAAIQREIDHVLADQELTYKSLKEMKGVTNALYETLRLHPPGGMLGRTCTEDYVLPGTDKVIEKGIMVLVPVLAIHKDPNYFPEPEAFKPERFRNNMEDIPKGAYFPFGGGPRICIAMRLAMLEMEVVIARLLSKYTVKLSPKTKTPLKLLKTSILQHVEGGVWVHFEERK